jgi:hypothetical protein
MSVSREPERTITRKLQTANCKLQTANRNPGAMCGCGSYEPT